MASTTTKILLFALVISAVLFVVSLVLTFRVFPDMVTEDVEEDDGNGSGDGDNNGSGDGDDNIDNVEKDVQLIKGTRQYDRFIRMPYEMEYKVYVYDVLNPDEVLNTGAKPQLREVGPYVYKQTRLKNKQYTDCDEDVIVYTEDQALEFDAEASSPLTLQDIHTVLNFPLMTMYQKFEQNNIAQYLFVCVNDIFPGRETLFIQSTVEELVLEGFNFCKPTGSITCNVVNRDGCKYVTSNRMVEDKPDGSYQFSYFNYKQGTDGQYTVKRGVEDLASLGRIVSWNGENFTDYWGDKTSCSAIRGTDSTIFQPQLDEGSQLSVFLTDLCRSLDLRFVEETLYHNLFAYVFELDEKALWSSTEDPNEDCYCTKLTHDEFDAENCYLDGVLDLQTCSGMPLLLSFPHFLNADPKYVANVEGLQPNQNQHKSYFVLEPRTGALLKSVKRTQLNAIIRPIRGVDAFDQFSNVALPLLWVEEAFTMPDSYLSDFEPPTTTTQKPETTTKSDRPTTSHRDVPEGVGWGLIGATAFLMLLFAGILTYRKLF